MTGQDDQLWKAVMAMDKVAKLALLECLRRAERGECSPDEAVWEFGRYCRQRIAVRPAGGAK